MFREALGDDFDPENPAGRFNPHLALAVVVPEYDWVPYGSSKDAIAKAVEANAGAWNVARPDGQR